MDKDTEGFGSDCPYSNSPSLTEVAVWGHATQSWGIQSQNLQHILAALHFRYDVSSEIKIYNPFTIKESLE